jgi:hypothetical protein
VTNETVGSLRQADSTTATGSIYTGAGSLGAQYSLGTRFGVFGELGVAYSRLRPPNYQSPISGITVPEPKGSSFGLRGSTGVILFF